MQTIRAANSLERKDKNDSMATFVVEKIILETQVYTHVLESTAVILSVLHLTACIVNSTRAIPAWADHLTEVLDDFLARSGSSVDDLKGSREGVLPFRCATLFFQIALRSLRTTMLFIPTSKKYPR